MSEEAVSRHEPEYIQVGVTALRGPDGSFLPSVPLYIRATPEAKAAEEALIGDIASVLAERMKTYVEGNRKVKAEAKKKAAKKPPRKEEKTVIDDDALEAKFKAMLEEYKAQTAK
jgi:hypothetical protein